VPLPSVGGRRRQGQPYPPVKGQEILPTGGLGRGALALPAVDLGLDHRAAHGLLADTDLPGRDRRSSRERGVLALVIIYRLFDLERGA
jgi:hypothetical protein